MFSASFSDPVVKRRTPFPAYSSLPAALNAGAILKPISVAPISECDLPKRVLIKAFRPIFLVEFKD